MFVFSNSFNNDQFHRDSVSGWAGFSLGVLIASCTANLNVGLRVVYLEYILVVSTQH